MLIWCRHGPPKLWHRVDSQGTWEWTAEFAPGVQPALLEQPPPPAPAQPPAAEPAEDIPLPEPAATALDGAVDADLGTTEFEIRLRSCLVEVRGCFWHLFLTEAKTQTPVRGDARSSIWMVGLPVYYRLPEFEGLSSQVGVGLPVVALPDGVYSTMFKGALRLAPLLSLHACFQCTCCDFCATLVLNLPGMGILTLDETCLVAVQKRNQKQP